MKIPYERRKSLYGYGFISVWLVGTVLWFLIPLIESIGYCFMDNKLLRPEAGGMKKVFLPFEGGQWLANFKYAFAADPSYKQSLLSVLRDTAITTPMILIFSLFIAALIPASAACMANSFACPAASP